MFASEFLREFSDDQMPSELGPEISLFDHDPPFGKGELREMAKKGFIVLDDNKWTYRLTLKSTQFVNKFIRNEGENQ